MEIMRIKIREQIKEFNEMIVVEADQDFDRCYCSGFPEIRWFGEEGLLATATIQHFKAISYNRFPAHAKISEESGAKLVEWMIDNKIPDPFGEIERRR